MLHITQVINARVATAFLAVMLSIPSGTAMAVPNSVVVHLSLSNTRVSLGEPIVLDYDITNISTEPVTLQLGKGQIDWLGITVLNQGGTPVPTVPDRTLTRYIDQLEVNSRVLLEVGRSLRGRIVVTRKYQIGVAGRYSIRVNVSLPYETKDGQPKQTFQSVWSSLVVVSMANSNRLLQKANELRDVAISKNVSERTSAIEALFSMPAEVVMPAWRSLIHDPTFSGQREVLAELDRIGTPAAATLLADLAGDIQQGEETQKAALGLLRSMYQLRGADVRSQIAPLLIRLDGKLPEITEPRKNDK